MIVNIRMRAAAKRRHLARRQVNNFRTAPLVTIMRHIMDGRAEPRLQRILRPAGNILVCRTVSQWFHQPE